MMYIQINCGQLVNWEVSVIYLKYLMKHHKNFNNHFNLQDLNTIVMDDDGFLPDNVMTPYQFFANYKRNDDDKPAFLMRFKCHHYGKLKVIIIMQKL